MIISYDKGLERQEFLERGKVLRSLGASGLEDDKFYSLGEVYHPVAALDRNALARMPNGELIKGLFNNPEIPNVSSYDGTNAEWFRLQGTWPVTIDTAVHLDGQRKYGGWKNVRSAIAIACGSGITGTYASNQNSGIEQITFSDVEPNSIEAVGHNLRFLHNQDLETSTIVSDGFEEIEGKYDLIIAGAVPATPGYPGLDRPLNPLFEGTDLLEKLLRDSPEHLTRGGRLLLSHSSCGELEFQDLARRYGASVENVLHKRENAYRVEFLEDQDWVDFLVERGGLVNKLKKVPFPVQGDSKMMVESGHDYWHNILVKEISFD